ncbi:MAG: exosome complex RNA-binding protein Rrp4 [Candidatus Asgardarchaeia archaeon]
MPLYVEQRSIVVPGDLIAEGDYMTGEGVYSYQNKIFATCIGLVNVKDNRISVVPLHGSYIPNPGDMVIGKIIDYSLTIWRVDINSPYVATLNVSNAIDKKFNILRDDIRRYYYIGDVIAAKVLHFSRFESPILTTKERGLGKLRGGLLVTIHPMRVPRLIGRKGSMINMIKEETRCKIKVGQNGVIWIQGRDPYDELIVVKAIKKIEREAHTSGLTDRIREFIINERRGGVRSE